MQVCLKQFFQIAFKNVEIEQILQILIIKKNQTFSKVDHNYRNIILYFKNISYFEVFSCLVLGLDFVKNSQFGLENFFNSSNPNFNIKMDYTVIYNNKLFRYLIHIVSNKFKMHKNCLKKYFVLHMICVEIIMIE